MTGDSGTNFAISAATLCRWPVRSLIRVRRSVIRASVACWARCGLDQLGQRILPCGPLLGQVLQRPGLVEKPLCVTAAQDDHRRVLHAVHVAGRGQPGDLLAGLVQLALQADHLAQGDLGGVLGVVQQRQVTAVQPGQLRGLRLQLGEFLGRVARPAPPRRRPAWPGRRERPARPTARAVRRPQPGRPAGRPAATAGATAARAGRSAEPPSAHSPSRPQTAPQPPGATSAASHGTDACRPKSRFQKIAPRRNPVQG